MPVAVVRARVKDFRQFREAHDRFVERMGGRLATALLMHRMYQSAEDPQEIMIVDQWVNVEAAQSLYSNVGFRDAEMNDLLLELPEWHWFLEIEARTIG
ncbi:MAG: hypothetical protein HYX94_03690 [Chloroflexi bacterium]|nr:hypothetical protein [Chloroflexota bacterium]